MNFLRSQPAAKEMRLIVMFLIGLRSWRLMLLRLKSSEGRCLKDWWLDLI